MKEEIKQLTEPSLEEDKKVVEDFLSNPENKKMAIELANQIRIEVGEGWFQAKSLIKKYKCTIEEAKAKFVVLGAFNLCAYKEEKGVQWYRIDLSQKIQRDLIVQEIQFHEVQISILKEKLTKLN